MNKLAFIFIGIAIGISMAFGIAGIIYTQWSSGRHPIEEIGAFGDAFGGILNPLLSMINIGFFIYISFKIAEIGNKTSEKLSSQASNYNYILNYRKEMYALLNEWVENFDDFSISERVYGRFFSIKIKYPHLVENIKYYKDTEEHLDNLCEITGFDEFQDEMGQTKNSFNDFIIEIERLTEQY